MSVREAPWGKFVARSALLLGVAGLALMAIFMTVLPVDLSGPRAELVAAARNPAVYRLAAFLDMLVWVGIGGVLLAILGGPVLRRCVEPECGRVNLWASLTCAQAFTVLGPEVLAERVLHLGRSSGRSHCRSLARRGQRLLPAGVPRPVPRRG